MQYPFDADEMITAAENHLGKFLTEDKRSTIRANVEVINSIVSFDDKAYISKIPLLDFTPSGCRYPNLYAEYKASGYHIDGIAEHIQVSRKLMKEVLEGNAELTYEELMNLHRYFMSLTDLVCVYGYIFSPKLSLLIPGTSKTKYRIKLLKEAVHTVDKLTAGKPLDWYDREQVDQAREVINQICNKHKAVPFAFYRWALDHVNCKIAKLTPKQLRCSKSEKKMAI